MVDNVTLDVGSGGETLATDDIAGIQHQRVKVQHGADGFATDVSAASPMPVDLGVNNDVTVTSGAITENNSTAILAYTASIDTNLATVAGAVAGTEMQTDIVSSVLPSGAATSAGQLADGHSVALSAIDNAVLDTIATNTTDGSTETTLAALNAKMVTGTVIGDVNLGATDNAVLDDIAAKLAPNTTNGHSFYLNQDTNAVASVKASAGTIYWIQCSTTDATPVYLNLYNVASGSVTLGTTTPSMQFIIPAQSDGNGAGGFFNFGPLGIQFGTAITVAAATTYNGLTDPGANVVITNIGYE